jgi:hypothetical protein
MLLVQGTGSLKDNVVFSGALYGPNVIFDLQNNAIFVGSVIAGQVTLSNNTDFTFNSSAGANTSGYSICGSSGGANQYGGG